MIRVNTGKNIDKVSTGDELKLVEDEFFRYCIRGHMDSNSSDSICQTLSMDVPNFLKRHEFMPDFDSIFMTCDKTYVNMLIQLIEQNPLFKYEDSQSDHTLTTSLKLYIRFLSSKYDPRTEEYKRDNEDIGMHTDGKVMNSHATFYERKKCNREACLAKYGYKCQVCGFDFEEHFGELGHHFIEVHHIVPLSTIGREYIINPEEDLIPLCSNCHSMIHRAPEDAMPIDKFIELYTKFNKVSK